MHGELSFPHNLPERTLSQEHNVDEALILGITASYAASYYSWSILD